MSETKTKRVTIKDVAQEAGISFSHAAQVLRNSPTATKSEATRKKVLDAARALNYRHHEGARLLRSGKSRTIGVLGRTIPLISAEPETERVVVDATAISDAIKQRGYNVALVEVRDDYLGREDNYDEGFEKMASLPVEGLIINRVVFTHCAAQVAMLQKAGIHVVLIGSDVNDEIDGVREDDRQGMFETTSHLIALGHRRIMYLGYIDGSYVGFKMRLQGYRDAMAAAGLQVTEDLLLDLGESATENEPKMAHDAVLTALSSGPKPDAIVCCCDEVAFGAMRAIYSLGMKVPADVALVGFDGIVLSAFTSVPLTTVALPLQEMAKGAVDLLFERITGQAASPAPQFRSYSPKLVIRESCGAKQIQGGPINQP